MVNIASITLPSLALNWHPAVNMTSITLPSLSLYVPPPSPKPRSNLLVQFCTAVVLNSRLGHVSRMVVKHTSYLLQSHPHGDGIESRVEFMELSQGLSL